MPPLETTQPNGAESQSDRESITAFVKEQMAAGAATDSTTDTKPTSEQIEQTDVERVDGPDDQAKAKPDEGKSEEDAKKEDDEQGGEKKYYSSDELADLIAEDPKSIDLNLVEPHVRATVRKMRAAWSRNLEALKHAAAAKPDDNRATTEETEEEDSLYTEEEIDHMLKSKVGKKVLREALADLGLDIDRVAKSTQTDVQAEALALVANDYPELADPEFQKACDAELARDKKIAETLSTSRDVEAVRDALEKLVLRTNRKVNLSQREKVAADKKASEKELAEAKRAREAENRNPGSKAAQSTRQGSSTEEPKDVASYVRQMVKEHGMPVR